MCLHSLEWRPSGLVEKELGRPLKEIFAEFSLEPLAAASISQVHEARTFNGEHMAVKVQRPGIKRIIDTDLEIMLQLAVSLEKHVQDLKNAQLVNLVKEFDLSIHKELNFSSEAANIRAFWKQPAQRSQCVCAFMLSQVQYR